MFLWNCAKRFLKITNLIYLVLDDVSFYKKTFFGWKVKANIWRMKFSPYQKKLENKNLKLSSFISFLSHHNRTCFRQNCVRNYFLH